MVRDLSSDAKAAILLSSAWGKSKDPAKPLSLSEYNKLVGWLKEECLRPGDLFSPDVSLRFRNSSFPALDPNRIESLLKRGGIMALEIERWLDSGMWILSRADSEYPERLKKVLGSYAPPVLYGFGPMELLVTGGIGIVGSRNVDDDGIIFTEELSRACAKERLAVISGGARGVDQTAMGASFDSGGTVIGAIANDLIRLALRRDSREAIQSERLVLFSPYHPDARFNVGNAMARNKLIYALANAVVVVSTTHEKGGTWAGAIENLKKWHVPLFVRDVKRPSGNKYLIQRGGHPFPKEALESPTSLQKPEIVYEPPALETHTSELALSDLPDATGSFTEVYELILPFLLGFISVSRTREEIKNFLEVSNAQTEEWLKQAIEAKILGTTKKGRKKAFVIASKREFPVKKICGNLDIYELILPHLLKFAEVPREKKEIVEHLSVRPKQADVWLRRAIREGKIEIRRKKPPLYVAQQNLF